MRYLLIALFLAFTLILSGCSQITAQPIGDAVADLGDSHADTGGSDDSGSEVKTCEDLSCQENAQCLNETLECACNEGFKECRNKCISNETCCDDSDCKENQTCKSGKCEYIPRICDFKSQFNQETGNCDCDEGYYYCDWQKKCIADDRCCSSASCGRGNRRKCSLTSIAMEICISGEYDSCKILGEGQSKFLQAGDKEYWVTLQDIFQDGMANIQIDDINITQIKKGDNFSLEGGRQLSIGEPNMFGGICERRDNS